jgi:hypothetical protein
MSKRYIVKIDDNYHYMCEEDRLSDESYDNLKEAIKRCEEITIRSLENLYEEGITSEKLSAQWSMFGEDPFITREEGEEGEVPFSARSFITDKICKDIIKNKKE